MNKELDVYGFGSFFRKSAKFQDIDILIIHRSIEYKSCQLAIWCKRILMSKITNADITILSRREEQNNSFIARSNACRIGKVCKGSAENDLNAILNEIKQIEGLKSN